VAIYTYGPGNELLTKGQREFSYDKNGNLIAKVFRRHDEEDRCDKDEHHDHDGRQWTYSYDFENRLIKAETKHNHESTIVTFKYDPFGRRIEKNIEQAEHGKTEESIVHSYVYDGQALILEFETRQGKDHGKRPETNATKYVHGPNIDEPLAMTRNNEVYFYHADGLGSIVALTDKRQKVVETYEYDSFGNLKDSDSSPSQPLTYTAREWDKETGLYYYRARYYDPMVGRFIGKDPIGFKGGDVNLYAYVQNNPIRYTDPSGLSGASGSWDNGNSLDGTEQQDLVCSFPAGVFNRWSCTKKCCFKHDLCYQKYGCNFSSWANTPADGTITSDTPACHICNIEAAKCIKANIGNNSCDTCDWSGSLDRL
jgi:RHS repeat-associated protein